MIVGSPLSLSPNSESSARLGRELINALIVGRRSPLLPAGRLARRSIDIVCSSWRLNRWRSQRQQTDFSGAQK
jgi:hypothetical protein